MLSSVIALCLLSNPQPPMVMRDEWGAKPVLEGAKRHEIRYVTIHHAGVASNPRRSLEDKLRGLQAFSQRPDKLASGKDKPAWPDIPYHFYISIDGRIGEARPVEYVGDTNTEYDPTGHLLIVLEGNFEAEEVPEYVFEVLVDLTTWACKKWNVPVSKVQSHRDYSAQTTCPGKDLFSKMEQLRNRVGANLR